MACFTSDTETFFDSCESNDLNRIKSLIEKYAAFPAVFDFFLKSRNEVVLWMDIKAEK
jgi:hypothetical protein